MKVFALVILTALLSGCAILPLYCPRPYHYGRAKTFSQKASEDLKWLLEPLTTECNPDSSYCRQSSESFSQWIMEQE